MVSETSLNFSPLEEERKKSIPTLPRFLRRLKSVSTHEGEATQMDADLGTLFSHTGRQPLITLEEDIEEKEHRALRVGVVFSGGQAPGGHNVICGLSEALKRLHPQSELIGFTGGPAGIVNNRWISLTAEDVAPYRNQGGFDLIGSGRTKIEKEEDLEAARKTLSEHRLDGMVIIGGDDSNTNAALLAEHLLKKGCQTRVIGVPKTIDGDVKGEHIEISFGFDTACKVYSELIGNLERDTLSAKKYAHFVRLMGRSTSHITLECALKTHPNLALIGEEIAAKKKTLALLVKEVADVVEARASKGKNYGVILLPEGLIEFIPEIQALLKELNTKLPSHLSGEAKETFDSLPEQIQQQLLLDRDPHGNVRVSQIATEELLITMVSQELKRRSFTGKFSPLAHFFGYEGRAGFPSLFDCNYCYALGHVAALLVSGGYTGYMARVYHLERPTEEWSGGGVPLTMMMHLEERNGKKKPVIRKYLVDLKGMPFELFSKQREKWALEDDYRYPGPIQFSGDAKVCEGGPYSLELERSRVNV